MPTITSCDILTPLPDQSGNADKFLFTDGNNLSWRFVGKKSIKTNSITANEIDITNLSNALNLTPPAGGGNGGNIGVDSITNVEIAPNTITPTEIDIPPLQTLLENNLNLLPNQTNQDGKFLKTDGSNAFWDDLDFDGKIINTASSIELSASPTIPTTIKTFDIENNSVVFGAIYVSGASFGAAESWGVEIKFTAKRNDSGILTITGKTITINQKEATNDSFDLIKNSSNQLEIKITSLNFTSATNWTSTINASVTKFEL